MKIFFYISIWMILAGLQYGNYQNSKDIEQIQFQLKHKQNTQPMTYEEFKQEIESKESDISVTKDSTGNGYKVYRTRNVADGKYHSCGIVIEPDCLTIPDVTDKVLAMFPK